MLERLPLLDLLPQRRSKDRLAGLEGRLAPRLLSCSSSISLLGIPAQLGADTSNSGVVGQLALLSVLSQDDNRQKAAVQVSTARKLQGLLPLGGRPQQVLTRPPEIIQAAQLHALTVQ